MAMDTRTLFFFVSTSALLTMTSLMIGSFFLLPRYTVVFYKLALLCAVAAFGFRPFYSMGRYVRRPHGSRLTPSLKRTA
jgi:hypothetical protein